MEEIMKTNPEVYERGTFH